MRLKFAEILLKEMDKNPDIVLISADLGYFILDKIREKYPDRFYNVQAAELCMVTTAIGLALKGKIPVCYSITPFLLHRPFEAIHLYLEGEQIPVKLVGSGRGKDYSHDGASHFESSWRFKKIVQLRPELDDLEQDVKTMLYNQKPTFLSLSR
jgi:transketolase C-terminal domain/subunit